MKRRIPMYGPLNSQFNEIKEILYTQVCGMQNSWPTADLPVFRNSQVHRQNLTELTYLSPSTVRNPSAENLTIQSSRKSHQKTTAPGCISSAAFLAATTCPIISLSQGTRHFGTCIHPSSYQPLHCLKPESWYFVPCCFRLLPCLARHPYLWQTLACSGHNRFSGHRCIP